VTGFTVFVPQPMSAAAAIAQSAHFLPVRVQSVSACVM
jgi:hypothetical protein